MYTKVDGIYICSEGNRHIFKCMSIAFVYDIAYDTPERCVNILKHGSAQVVATWYLRALQTLRMRKQDNFAASLHFLALSPDTSLERINEVLNHNGDIAFDRFSELLDFDPIFDE